MRTLCALLLLAASAFAQNAVIQVSTALDGRGHVLHNTRIVVADGKIVRLDPQAAPVTYDLTGYTVLPGWIDTEAMPAADKFLPQAMAVPGLKIVFGTDAVAGAEGRNAEEFIYRVRAGHMPAMQAMVGANSLAAESLHLQDQIGSLAPGLQADIIALEGDPLTDITTVRRVVFVMKGGKVYRNHVHRAGRRP